MPPQSSIKGISLDVVNSYSHQADFDAVHHEFEDVLLQALLAGRREGEGGGGVRDRGGAALVRGSVSRFRGVQLMVRGVGDVQQIEKVLADICDRGKMDW